MNRTLQLAFVAMLLLGGVSGCIVLGWPMGPVSVTQRTCDESDEIETRLDEYEARIAALEKAVGIPAATSPIPANQAPAMPERVE